MNRMKVGELAHKLKQATGTMIILDHLRINSLTEELELRANETGDDFVVDSGEELGEMYQQVCRASMRREGKISLDYSLRAFCEVMFIKPKMEIRIGGKPVEPTRFDLMDKKKVLIQEGGIPKKNSGSPIRRTTSGSKQVLQETPVLALIGRWARWLTFSRVNCVPEHVSA